MPKLYQNWKDYPMRNWRWKNFSPQEMACKGTGRLMLDPVAMDALQALRDRLGRPLIITSAYRSPEHNRNVGGARASKHMEGIAFDIRQDNHDPAQFIEAAKAVGFRGIGTYPRSGFIHVDTRLAAFQWGDPFPPSANGLAAQPPREPETLAENPRAQVAGGIGIGSGAIALADQASREGGILDRLQEPTTLIIVVAAVAAWLFWSEWKGRRQ
ncbi:YcbK family protein [Roseinatronobacter alkalisoli]|uniref:Murein endopeptidase K n=1 Tax=Roseinatronobacter alkalisoli TaxID=3028235 RepID=A0ABT5TEA5_9RHOB|nr:D-Ala-D-Ala carboxypeptidase family metallohydrolase [Roseinatronobacter sp. HJB301]MDD7973454.1 D-Ala-D-Ala carboxypeptidase family metallohydrolase [Roseinatronobacter sp. HJB301]